MAIKVLPFDRNNFFDLARSRRGYSRQAGYIYEYLSDLKARTIVVEEQYIDKNYLIDYQKFYSRSFENIKRFTKRLHFFCGTFSAAEFEQVLDNNGSGDLGNYLGFVVVRPIEDADGRPLVGRSLLRTYSDTTDGLRRVYVRVENHISLFGIQLGVESIPFQAQDQGVSACATVALWTTLQSLVRVFGVQERSPAEITEIATEFPSQSRVFPQAGLNLNQMLTCIRSTDPELDVETINGYYDAKEYAKIKASGDDKIATAVKAYTTFAAIPLIGTLKLSKRGETDYHAVVIDGYQCDIDGKVTELYVHDDQIGPYSRVKPGRDFRYWKNSWNDQHYTVRLEHLLVPIYHKIRLPFSAIYDHYLGKKKGLIGGPFNINLYLTTVQKYKGSLIERNAFKGKTRVLQRNMPHYIWVERTVMKGNSESVQDDVFDGTAIKLRKLITVEYQ
jgi:hypothetical protein